MKDEPDVARRSHLPMSLNLRSRGAVDESKAL